MVRPPPLKDLSRTQLGWTRSTGGRGLYSMEQKKKRNSQSGTAQMNNKMYFCINGAPMKDAVLPHLSPCPVAPHVLTELAVCPVLLLLEPHSRLAKWTMFVFLL